MGNYLTKPNKRKKTITGENLELKFGASEMQGWRLTMEDAKITNLSLDECSQLFGVFDGHGGHEVSEFVSNHFEFELLNSEAYNSGEISEALRSTFYKMDEILRSPLGSQELFRISKRLPSNYPVKKSMTKKTVGCTANVVFIRGKDMYVANAGDSRCVLSRGGRALDLSTDHKPGLKREKIRILNAGGRVIEGRVNGGLNLTRSIGDFMYKNKKDLMENQQLIICEPDISHFEIQDSDHFIVLACDGIWEMMTSQQVVDFVQQKIKTQDLGIIVEELFEKCIAPTVTTGLGCDNMTAIIVEFKH